MYGGPDIIYKLERRIERLEALEDRILALEKQLIAKQHAVNEALLYWGGQGGPMPNALVAALRDSLK
jgi:hypothetical protein